MRRLSLDDLKVESYALQVSEAELAEVKGGTSWLCVDLGLAVAGLIVNAYQVFHEEGSTGTTTGSATESGQTTIYSVSADSMIVTAPDGTMYRIYNAEMDSIIMYQ